MLSGVCPAGFRALPLALLSTEQLAQRPGQSQTESLRGALLQHRDRRNRQRTAAVLPRVIPLEDGEQPGTAPHAIPHAGLRHTRRPCHAPEWPLSDQLPGPPRFLLHVPVYPSGDGVRFFRRRVALSCCPPEVASHRGCINCSGRYAVWRLAYGLCAGMGHDRAAALLPWPPRWPDQSAGICDEGHPNDSYQMRLICNRSLERSPTATPSSPVPLSLLFLKYPA